MKPLQVMVIAGETSGDMLAAELVKELERQVMAGPPGTVAEGKPGSRQPAPSFFGAGGPRMAAAGVELAVDMTRHSIIGLTEALKKLVQFYRIFRQLRSLAFERSPEVILCVDFSGFNRRFAHAIRQSVRAGKARSPGWNPRLVQYVSPQVWASREGRAQKMAADYDLLLAIFPFEKAWYAQRVPKFAVEFVGHPLLDRYAHLGSRAKAAPERSPTNQMLTLLPGSRPGELRRHLPVMLAALTEIHECAPTLQAQMVLPSDELVSIAQGMSPSPFLKVRRGGLPEALMQSTLAMASTGTVTMECAFFGVPTVALYKTSWSTYQVGKRIVKVKYLAMPNILADEPLFPEFIQNEATAANLATATLKLLKDEPRRLRIRARLAEIVATLGGPGASERASKAVLNLLK